MLSFDLDVDDVDGNGLTPLQHAVRSGHGTIARLLVGRGADARRGNPAAWDIAVELDRVEIVELLIRAGAVTFDFDAAAAMHGAGRPRLLQAAMLAADADTGSAIIVRAVNERRVDLVAGLAEAGVSFRHLDARLSIPLIVSSVRSGSIEMVRALLKSDLDRNAADPQGMTPLHQATREGTDAVVQLLLEHDALTDRRDDKQRTALHWASELGHIAIVRSLLEYRADKLLQDADGKKAVDLARDSGHSEIVTLLEPKLPPPPQWRSGIIKFYRESEGFGYITPDDGGDDVRFDQNLARRIGIRNMHEGERVAFEWEYDGIHRGPNATSMKLLDCR